MEYEIKTEVGEIEAMKYLFYDDKYDSQQYRIIFKRKLPRKLLLMMVWTQVAVASETVVMMARNCQKYHRIICSSGTSTVITINFTRHSTLPDHDLHFDSRGHLPTRFVTFRDSSHPQRYQNGRT